MSFSEQLGTAIAAAHTSHQLDELSKSVAVAWGAHILDDDAAGAALEALAVRRRELGDPRTPSRRPFPVPSRRPRPRSPNRERSLCRRRREVAPAVIPPHVAEHFTPGQLSALAVIARDIQINGCCKMCIDKIAAWAGVCRRLVQQAQRIAERLGFLAIEARPRRGRKSKTNVVRVVCSEWAAWLRLDRVQENAPHGIQKKNSTLMQRKDPANWRFPPAAERSLSSPKKGERQDPTFWARLAAVESSCGKVSMAHPLNPLLSTALRPAVASQSGRLGGNLRYAVTMSCYCRVSAVHLSVYRR